MKDIEVLMAAEMVREFLLEKDCCETEYYDSDNEVIMRTDIGILTMG